MVLTLASIAAATLWRRGPPPVAAAALPAPAARAHPGALDVTFLMTADTHVGYLDDVIGGRAGQTVDEARDAEIRAMNEIAGRPWPAAIGGAVAEPRGVLVAGDKALVGRPAE